MECDNIYCCHCGNGCPWLSCNLFVCFLFITTFIKEKNFKMSSGKLNLISTESYTPILSRAQSNDKWSRSQLLALFSPRYTYFAETTSRLNLCLKI